MTILVTGASKGIGFAIASKFVREVPNCSIAICSRTEDQIMDAAVRLRSLSSSARVLPIVCDVASEANVHRMASEVQSNFGTPDVLINNAGFGIFRPLQSLDESEFTSVIDANLRGVFLVTSAFLPAMRAKRAGTIVTIASLAAKNGFVGGAAYCASKFGVRGLMQSLFLEVRTDNIRVTTIFPGSVNTEFYRAGPSENHSPSALQPEDIAECVYGAVMLPSSATISELDIRPTNKAINPRA